MSRAVARSLTAALIALCAVLVGPGVAWAHAGGLTSSSNEPVVVGAQPPVPGLRVTVVEFGARLRLDNQTGQRVTVLPPPGSMINTLPVVDPDGSALWSDPRIVAAAGRPRPPDARSPWEIPLRVGDTPVAVVGEQRWPPPPDPVRWWLLTLAAAVLPGCLVALSARLGRLRSRRRRAAVAGGPGAGRDGFGRWTLAVLTAAVMVAHAVHLYGSALVVAQGPVVVVFLAAAGFAVLGWPLGLAGAWLTVRGRPAGPLLCCVAGALLAVVIAPADLFSFHDAVIPFAWSADLDRLLIAVTVGGGLGAVGASWLLLRQPMPTPTPDEANQPAEGLTR